MDNDEWEQEIAKAVEAEVATWDDRDEVDPEQLKAYLEVVGDVLETNIEQQVDNITVLETAVTDDIPVITYRTDYHDQSDIIGQMGAVMSIAASQYVEDMVPSDRIKFIIRPPEGEPGPCARWHIEERWAWAFDDGSISKIELSERVSETIETFRRSD